MVNRGVLVVVVADAVLGADVPPCCDLAKDSVLSCQSICGLNWTSQAMPRMTSYSWSGRTCALMVPVNPWNVNGRAMVCRVTV